MSKVSVLVRRMRAAASSFLNDNRHLLPAQIRWHVKPIIRGPRNGDLHADIDLIDKCNLQCPTCWRGVGTQKNTSALMPLPQFREIVAKVKAEGYPNVALINWTEPFLNKSLHKYIPIVKRAGLDCWLSSNLSLPPQHYLPTIVSALAAGADILFVSVSGFTQEVYERNHKKGRLDWIRANLEGISKELYSGKIKTSVWIRYLEWPYNSHEAAPWADYAKKLGIGIDVVPAFNDPDAPLASPATYQKELTEKLEHAVADPSERVLPDKICTLIADRVALDAKGDAYLCCAFPNSAELKIGSYADMDEGELLLRRHEHWFCKQCANPRRDATAKDHARFAQAWDARSLKAKMTGKASEVTAASR